MTGACPTCGATLQPDHFSFDAEAGIIVSGGLFVTLPRREADILSVLLSRRGRQISKTALFQAVYGGRDEPDNENVIESHISKLRKKMLPLGLVISSERFKGYQLKLENRHA